MNERIREVRSIALALLLSCSGLGCNPRQSSRVFLGKVSGKITYKGEPLPGGFLHFYNGTNHVGMGVIKPGRDGAYEASVAAGPVQILVNGDFRPDRVAMSAENGSRGPRRVPGVPPDSQQAKLLDEVQEKYGSLKTARPLNFVISPGEQTLNINLD